MDYRPAQCNIGPQQRRRRAALSVGGLVAAGAIVVAHLAGHLPELLLPGVFVPFAVAFEWGIQAYEGFCVRLALLGRYDFSGAGNDAEATGGVSDPEHRRRDRRHAFRISVISVALAAVATALVVAVL